MAKKYQTIYHALNDMKHGEQREVKINGTEMLLSKREPQPTFQEVAKAVFPKAKAKFIGKMQ